MDGRRAARARALAARAPSVRNDGDLARPAGDLDRVTVRRRLVAVGREPDDAVADLEGPSIEAQLARPAPDDELHRGLGRAPEGDLAGTAGDPHRHRASRRGKTDIDLAGAVGDLQALQVQVDERGRDLRGATADLDGPRQRAG